MRLGKTTILITESSELSIRGRDAMTKQATETAEAGTSGDVRETLNM